MKTYARIEDGRVVEIIAPMTYGQDAPKFILQPFDADNTGAGMNGLPADWPTYKAGDEVPIEKRFTPEFVATLIDVTDTAVEIGYVYERGEFKPYVAPAPSAAEVVARNTATRDSLNRIATDAIAPLQDAVELDIATADGVAKLKAWKTYRVLVSRVDLTLAQPVWPQQPSD